MNKVKTDTSKTPDPKSNRSKRRKNRGFVDTKVSTRKGRRTEERSRTARTLGRELLQAGESRTLSTSGLMYHAGGANHPHKI